MNMMLSKTLKLENSKVRDVKYLKAIIVDVFHIKHMCSLYLASSNIIMSFRTPAPVGVGGVFLCRA
jgi:hypothetical protein